jgi:acyl-CoA synthetase (NDP forming)
MQRRGLPIAFVVALGNQAMVGLAELIEALAAEPRVSAIGLYIEGIGDPAAFQRAVRQARAAGTPVVALKVGRSPTGERTALTHTASLAGGDAVADAFLHRLGVPRLDSIEALLETLKLLHVHGALPGNRIVSLSCSGGEAALTADAAHGRALELRPFEPDEAQAIAATVHPLVHVANPLDYHTFDWARPERLRATFEAVMHARFDLALLVIDLPRDDRCDPADWWIAIEAWRIAARATGRPTALIATVPEGLPETIAARLIEGGIAPLQGLEPALSAIEAAAVAGRPLEDEAIFGRAIVLRLPVRTLDEAEAKRRLEETGLAVPPGRIVASVEAAHAALAELGPPVALKLLGAAHKTEQQALRLGLADQVAVGGAAAELLARGERLLIERMVEGGVAELLVGIARDPVIGLHLVIGAGGVLAELIGDRVILLLPSSAGQIRAALRSLRAARLIEGFRGRPAGDLEAVVQAVLAVQRFALDHLHALDELDVNPLIVRPDGAVAVDALIRIRET